MALEPVDEKHAAQILAGIDGRMLGHKFEERLTAAINKLGQRPFKPSGNHAHVVDGIPAVELLAYICRDLGAILIDTAEAWWMGGLATSGEGDRTIPGTGLVFMRSKSDVILRLKIGGESRLIGVGVKTCNAKSPTNAQLFFSTATAFSELLRRNGIKVSRVAEHAMKMFCGDTGFRPLDHPENLSGRLADTNRWFWEELPKAGRVQWESLLKNRQDDVTRALLRYAYADDPLPPEYVLHQRHGTKDEDKTPLAIFSVDELIAKSRRFGSFSTKEYQVRKGTFKNDPSTHLAPRFGFVQFQRGGQKQHPTQLQFNLKARYFD